MEQTKALVQARLLFKELRLAKELLLPGELKLFDAELETAYNLLCRAETGLIAQTRVIEHCGDLRGLRIHVAFVGEAETCLWRVRPAAARSARWKKRAPAVVACYLLWADGQVIGGVLF